MTSDAWEHTAIFLTWDEWGGFYDPIMPPEVDPIGLGIRVPLVTISPYTQRGVIDTELGEFSTPLRFIADNWGLELPDAAHRQHPQLRPRVRLQAEAARAGHRQEPGTDLRRSLRDFPEGFDGWEPGTEPDKGSFV